MAHPKHAKNMHFFLTFLTLITTAFECFSFRVRLHEIIYSPVSFVTSNRENLTFVGVSGFEYKHFNGLLLTEFSKP